jgi:hypothetical protein
MRTNNKTKALMGMGLSLNVISKLNENQINTLFEKFGLLEQGAVMISADKASRDPQKLKDLTARGINIRIEGDVTEDNVDVTGSAMGGATTQAPHQIMSPDGMGDDSDKEIDKYEDMTEQKSKELKKKESNPFAICHAQLGPERDDKFERCVKKVKKSLKEGESPYAFFIEEKIVSLVESYIQPRMTKKDLMKMIEETPMIRKPLYRPKTKGLVGNMKMNKPIGKLMSLGKTMATEDAPTTAPPKTRPTTKPRPGVRPSHPGKNPKPGVNPEPKAMAEKAKKDVLKIIKDILNGK